MIYVTDDASVDLFSADKFTVIMIYEKKNIYEKKIDMSNLSELWDKSYTKYCNKLIFSNLRITSLFNVPLFRW